MIGKGMKIRGWSFHPILLSFLLLAALTSVVLNIPSYSYGEISSRSADSVTLILAAANQSRFFSTAGFIALLILAFGAGVFLMVMLGRKSSKNPTDYQAMEKLKNSIAEINRFLDGAISEYQFDKGLSTSQDGEEALEEMFLAKARRVISGLEKKLAEQSKRIEYVYLVTEAASSAIIELDRDGRIEEYSVHLSRMMGTQRTFFKGLSFASLISSDQGKENFSKDNKEWAGGINSVFAITSSGKEKQPIIIEGKGKAI